MVFTLLLSASVLAKSVDQGEAQPCEEGQVEFIFNLSRIIENMDNLKQWGVCWRDAPGAIKGDVL